MAVDQLIMALKPSFLIIGGRRCGTNWLQHSLIEHPDIFMPPGRPGFDGFDERAAALYSGESAVGLVNAVWLTSPGMADQLVDRYPGARLVVILRSPVDRAYSWYWQRLKQGDGVYRREPSFEDAIESDPTILEEGFYYKYLKRYLDLYPPDDRLVLLFDGLKKDPRSYLKGVFSFLHVDTAFVPSVLDEKVNYSAGLKNRHVHQLLRKAKSVVRQATGDNPWHRLARLYADDVSSLARTLDLRLDHWV